MTRLHRLVLALLLLVPAAALPHEGSHGRPDKARLAAAEEQKPPEEKKEKEKEKDESQDATKKEPVEGEQPPEARDLPPVEGDQPFEPVEKPAEGAKKPGEEAEKKEEPKWDVNNPPGPLLEVTIDTAEGTWMSLDVSPDGRDRKSVV